MDLIHGGQASDRRQDHAETASCMGANGAQTSPHCIKKCFQDVQHVCDLCARTLLESLLIRTWQCQEQVFRLAASGCSPIDTRWVGEPNIRILACTENLANYIAQNARSAMKIELFTLLPIQFSCLLYHSMPVCKLGDFGAYQMSQACTAEESPRNLL